MDFSPTVLVGLQVAGSIGDKPFAILMDHAVEKIIGKDNDTSLQDNPSLSKENQMQCKESFSALMTLFIEAAKSDVDATEVGNILEECRFTPDRVDVVKTKYLKNKEMLRSCLRRVGSSLPHVVDVDWRLDYYIKGKNLERVNKAVYLISLKTETSDNKDKDVQFTCTEEQLQDLVIKLRDACKSFERLTL